MKIVCMLAEKCVILLLLNHVASVFEAQRDDPAILTTEIADRTSADRREFMEALHARDPDTSRRLMSEQIQKGRKTVLSFLRSKRN